VVLSRSAVVGMVLCLVPVHAHADAAADATYIVDQTITREVIAGSLQAFGPIMGSALENDFRENGIAVSDRDKFIAILLDEFMDPFVALFRQRAIDLYVSTFSPRELSDMATFYRSESGQSLVRRTPGLMAEAAGLGQQLGVEVAQTMDSERLLSRLQAEGVIVGPAE
jgi:hypothetical protein